MSKLIKIALLLLAFTAQSVMAVSVHCSMDMSSMDMSSDMHSDMDTQADMHAAMGHHDMGPSNMDHGDMEGASDKSMQSMDCCDSINECPTGTCSAPALSDVFVDVLSIESKSAISTEYNHQVQTAQSNLFRPPILA